MRNATQTRLTLLVCSVLVACSPGDGSGAGITFGPDGGAVITGDVVSTTKCSNTPGCGPSAVNTYVDDSALFDAVLEDLVTKGCSRFFSDCNYLCSQIFYDCGANMTQCVQQSVKRYGDDYDHPVVNAALAVTCGQDVLAAACSDIPPDTRACEDVIVEGCADDSGDTDGAYIWSAPAAVGALPSLLAVHLCDEADKWLALSLTKGQTVTLQATAPKPTFGNVSLRFHIASPQADEEPTRLDTDNLGWADEDAASFGPVDVDGDYLIELHLSSAPTLDLGLRVDLTEAP
ncbi:MAG: hypothetical protein R3F39_01220 [Myxococcota bacterium]